MDIRHAETALFLLKLTDDPLYKSALRAILDDASSDFTHENAVKFIESGWKSYLTLYSNSGKHRKDEPRQPIEPS
ncbi:MAG TPA: hypothetical protein PKL28_07220 [Rhodocyclaceae bacterium]|nr:hypothetical protein [Rhodocyclaceae bacterium]